MIILKQQLRLQIFKFKINSVVDITKSSLSKSMQPSIPPIGRVGHFLCHKFTYPANHSDCKTVVNIIKI